VILTLVIGSAITFQLAAAVMAFRLTRLTKTGVAWSLIATALALMAMRRVLSLHYLILSDPVVPPDLLNELIGLSISIFMLAGIAGIGPLFSSIKSTGERLRILSQRLMEAQESERRHIARELHDEIGQALTMVKINLQTIQRASDPVLVAQRVEESIGVIEPTLQQVRNLSLRLRPSLLDDLGLVAALRWYLDRQSRTGDFALQFKAEPLAKRLPAEIETACFRIVQEAITNVIKHSEAREVDVTLRRFDRFLELVVCDTGIGFNVALAQSRAAEGGSLGLLSMTERASLVGGTFDIRSELGRGTEIRARLPIE
jgi:signal transduction histidine kinase